VENERTETQNYSPFLPEIRRARLDRLTIYEVSESELDVLAKGSPDSIYLNFAIGSVSAAIAFSITLATTDIDSARTFYVFVIATIIGYSFGALLLLLWWKNHRSISSVVSAIRNRLPPEGSLEVIASEGLTIIKSRDEASSTET
jgi:hypothetical protein